MNCSESQTVLRSNSHNKFASVPLQCFACRATALLPNWSLQRTASPPADLRRYAAES
jgi:hypothetical protein